MKIEATDIIREIEKQKVEVKPGDFISNSFNIGLNSAIIIVKYLDSMEELRSK